MLTFSLPRFLTPSSWGRNWGERQPFRLPPPTILDIENAPEKHTRALKHLLKLNHANYAVLGERRCVGNWVSSLLNSAYHQGADADGLGRLYEAAVETGKLDAWVDSPGEISMEDWRDYLGCREYQRAFVNYFEDELVRHGYDWKQVLNDYIFEGEQPLFHSIIADLGTPLLHLSHAYELSSRETAMQALGLAATCYTSSIHKYLDDPVYAQIEPSYHATSPIAILQRVRNDKRFHGLFGTPGNENINKILQTRETALLDHWNAWKIVNDNNEDSNTVGQFREMQELATALLAGAQTYGMTDGKYDYFFVHILNITHALRILLPTIPPRFQIPLVRQWWLLTLAIYVAQLRPEINIHRIRDVKLNGRNWGWAADMAVKGQFSSDAKYVMAIRTLREAAETWGDAEGFWLKAAVKFAGEFGGWGGFV